MDDDAAHETGWRPLDYREAWAPFDERFHFRPDHHDRSGPAIDLPPDGVVIDLSSVFAEEGARFAAGEAAINAAALRAFVWVAGDDSLTALDWQHPAYRYSPASHALSQRVDWPVPVFPNGDYFAHFSREVVWGTFGHPWQQTLTVWGEPLVASLGSELLTWLPRHAQSPL